MVFCSCADQPVMPSLWQVSYACPSKGCTYGFSRILCENLISAHILHIDIWTISQSLPFQFLPLGTDPTDAGFPLSLKDTLLDS